MQLYARAVMLSVLSTAALLLAAQRPSPKVDPLSAVIDSISGTVEIQRAGQQTWEPADKGVRLANNDIIRVAAKSTARLIWPDRSRAYLRESSQMLINLFRDSPTGFLSRHTTLFFGAALFIIESALPSAGSRHDTKVFTPTAVVAVRGTSFQVEVEQTRGSTSVGVLKGTVLVKNIIRDVSTFVTAGNGTSVIMGADPQRPEPIGASLVQDLKKWVPPPVVDANLGSRSVKADTGKALTNRVVVFPFANTSRYEGPWNVGKGIAGLLAYGISSADTTRTATLTDDGTDPLAVGVRESARFVVSGEVLNLDVSKKARINTGADKYYEYSHVFVAVRVCVVDVLEKEQRFERVFTSEQTDTAQQQMFWSGMKKMKFDLGDPSFSASIVGKSVAAVVRDASKDVVRFLK